VDLLRAAVLTSTSRKASLNFSALPEGKVGFSSRVTWFSGHNLRLVANPVLNLFWRPWRESPLRAFPVGQLLQVVLADLIQSARCRRPPVEGLRQHRRHVG
jgi:hypothetical protein